MGDDSKIEWTDATWNPLAGCTKVSEGCRNCYAMKAAHRMNGTVTKYEGTTKMTKNGPQWTGRVNLDFKALYQPLRWKKPRIVFVNSMSDLFHKDVPDDFIAQVFAVMGRAQQHTFQVLTKRADRLAYLTTDQEFMELVEACDDMLLEDEDSPIGPGRGWDPLERRTDDERASGPDWSENIPTNMWLGVSVEDQATADERIPHLLKVPAAVRFLSVEPLLGPVDLEGIKIDLGGGLFGDVLQTHHVPLCGKDRPYPKVDWAIVGGESGPGARPMNPQWARSLRDQCVAADVPFFFKQWGAWSTKEDDDVDYGEFHEDPLGWVDCCMCVEGTESMWRIGKKRAGRLLDGREWNEMPTLEPAGLTGPK